MLRFVFWCSFVFMSVPATAQELIYFGEGKIPEPQVVDVICEVNGMKIVCGKTENNGDQPIWVCSKQKSKNGSIFLKLPTKDSPRGVAFIEGDFPNYKPVDRWVKGEGNATSNYHVPASSTEDDSWRVVVGRKATDLDAPISPNLIAAAKAYVERAGK